MLVRGVVLVLAVATGLAPSSRAPFARRASLRMATAPSESLSDGELAAEVTALRAEVEAVEAEVARGRAQLERLGRQKAEAEAAAYRRERIRRGSEAAAARMREAGATRVRLVLFNDPVNKRERVESVLTDEAGLSARDANSAMMSAHKRGRGVIATFEEDALERAEALRAKLTAANLLVELVPVLDGEGQPSDAKPAGAVEEK